MGWHRNNPGSAPKRKISKKRKLKPEKGTPKFRKSGKEKGR